MKKKWKIYIGFFLALTAAFFLFVFWDYDFSASKLKVINDHIEKFSFTDQNGKKFDNKNTDGKVYVAEYFFTTCKGICPKMNANMRRVYDVYKNEPGFLIASHTCMPETDSVPVLKQYENLMINGKPVQTSEGSYHLVLSAADSSLPIQNKNWFFLTGDKSELYKMARESYMIDNNKPDSMQINDQFIHTQFFALVDKNGRLRGVYDGLIEAEIQKLIKDIKGLLKEKITSKHFMSGFSNNPG